MNEVANLEIKVGLQVTKPISVVYDAIVNPDIMRNYFISASTGRMAPAAELGSVQVSRTMPVDMVLPEPVLLVTTGTSLLGLKPTATSVPGGDRANLICAACVDRAVATMRANICFILPCV